MKTWKQGIIGSINLKSGLVIYVKCLKYPLAAFFESYDIEKKELTFQLFHAFLDLSVLMHITKLEELKLTANEKMVSREFSIKFNTKVINIENKMNTLQNTLLNFDDLDIRMISLRSTL